YALPLMMTSRKHAMNLPKLLSGLVLTTVVCLPLQTYAELGDEIGDTQAADDGRLPLDELQLFVQIFDQIRNAYVEEVDDQVLFESAIEGMLAGLDPHSAYLTDESFDDLQESTSGEFGGLGIEVGAEDGFIRVIAPIDGTPADKAGLRTGDLIIKLDDQA